MEASGSGNGEPTQMPGKKQAREERARQEPAGRDLAGHELVGQELAGQELAAQTADLVGDLAREDRSVRRRLKAPFADLLHRGEQISALRSRLSTLGAQAAEQSSRVAGQGSRVAGRGAQIAGRGVRWGASRLVDQVLTIAPRLPVRDRATLRAQFPGRSPDELADALIDGAARMSASVGAAVGTWAVLPFLPGIPAEMAAETLTVVGIEIKLVAELHEVFGMRAPGGVVDRMTAYTAAWADRRGVGLTPAGLVLAVGSPLRRRLQRRLAGRAGRSAISLGPLLTGAAASALINRRETKRLGRDVRDDLRKRSPHSTALWPESLTGPS
jgi:hypothetical protein